MKALGIALALAFAVWLLWGTATPVTAPVASTPERVHRPEHPRGTPRDTPVLTTVTPLRLKPDSIRPERRAGQDELVKYLGEFAVRAELTAKQWERFERDLVDLAESETAAYMAAGTGTGDFTGVSELNKDLGRELETRCAQYMTERQLAILQDYRPWALIMRVRQAFLTFPGM
jgi:hypothetical protein